MVIAILSVLAVLLLLCSFYQSLTEMSFFRTSRIKLDYLASKGDKHAIVVQNIMKKPETLLSAILISNTIANTIAPIFAAIVFVSLFGENIGYTVAAIAMPIIILIFCEIPPKVIASHYPERVAF